MNQALALFALALGLVYADLDGSIWQRWFFPALAVSGIWYLIGLQRLVVLGIGILAVRQSELQTASTWHGVVMPVVAVLCFLYVLFSLAWQSSGGGSGGGGGDGGFDGGGDGGGD